MKLYSSLTSPYARKIRVLVRELGLADDVEEIPVDPFKPSADFLVTNPLSKLPVLETAAGDTLPDSKLIADYLQSHSRRKIARLPRGRERWATLRRAYLAEGILDAAVATVLEKRRPESIVYTGWLDRQADAIRRTLTALESEAQALLPPEQRPGMPEIGIGVALGYLNFRLPYLDWVPEHPQLDAWFRGFAQRPSMRETQPPDSS